MSEQHTTHSNLHHKTSQRDTASSKYELVRHCNICKRVRHCKFCICKRDNMQHHKTLQHQKTRQSDSATSTSEIKARCHAPSKRDVMLHHKTSYSNIQKPCASQKVIHHTLICIHHTLICIPKGHLSRFKGKNLFGSNNCVRCQPFEHLFEASTFRTPVWGVNLS